MTDGPKDDRQTPRHGPSSFKKEDRPWGPPMAQRPSPEQIAAAVTPHGFRWNPPVDLGDNFLLVFGCE